MIQKCEYLSLQEQSCRIINKYFGSYSLGSPRKPQTFLSIDAIEQNYGFCNFHLSIQSWVHNYLHNGIKKNGVLKRVKRSYLLKLYDTYIKIYDYITIYLDDHYDMDNDSTLKLIIRYTDK